MIRLFRNMAWIAAALASAPLVALAQDPDCLRDPAAGNPEAIGCVNRLSARKLLLFRRTVKESGGVEIQRHLTGDRIRPIRRGATVGHLDNIDIAQPIFVELLLKQGNNESRAVLSHQGSWSIRRDTLPQLIASHGQGFIEQIEGRLEAYLKNTLMTIHGTSLFYELDSTGVQDYVYLHEGRISFPEFGFDVEGVEILLTLRDGLAPERALVGAQNIDRWRSRTELSSRRVWDVGRKPILQRPGFWLTAAGLVGGAVLADCTLMNLVCNGDESRTTRGIIRIPIPE